MGYEERQTAKFIDAVSTLTGIPGKKLKEYAKENNPFNILEHPQTIDPNEKQRQKIDTLNEFIASYRVLKLYEEDKRILLNSASKAGQYFLSLMGGMKDKERFLIAFLDNGHNIIETKKISEGSIGQTVVYPRDILKAALATDCKSIIMAHNHPGNSSNPSIEDRTITQRAVDIFHPLNIKVMDHIIVAGNGYTSFAEKGYMPESSKELANYEPIALKDKSVMAECLEDEEEWEP